MDFSFQEYLKDLVLDFEETYCGLKNFSYENIKVSDYRSEAFMFLKICLNGITRPIEDDVKLALFERVFHIIQLRTKATKNKTGIAFTRKTLDLNLKSHS